jgi:glutamate synthase domain-containing protein 2
VVFAVIVFWFIEDVTQKKHAVLRNYPVIGRLRYFFEKQGEYFRQYFFAGDREEMPFNRATRAWVYRVAKKEDGSGLIGFGSTYDIKAPGAILFVNAPSRCRSGRRSHAAAHHRRGLLRAPVRARSIVNISGMSFGAISKPAVQALSRGAAEPAAGSTPAKAASRPSPRGGRDVIMQIGTAKYGIRDKDGAFSPERAKELAKVVKAFEIKLSQGAKPGKGGVLPAARSPRRSRRSAASRRAGLDQPQPPPRRGERGELLDQVPTSARSPGARSASRRRSAAGVPERHGRERAQRGLEYAPDFLVIDGGEGGSGAAPQALFDHMSLSIEEALPRAADVLYESG